MITVVDMIDLGTQPPRYQVWIVPGSMSDHDDGGEFDGVFIEDYLDARGICIGRCYDTETAKKLIEHIQLKFERAGIKVEVVTTAND